MRRRFKRQSSALSVSIHERRRVKPLPLLHLLNEIAIFVRLSEMCSLRVLVTLCYETGLARTCDRFLRANTTSSSQVDERKNAHTQRARAHFVIKRESAHVLCALRRRFYKLMNAPPSDQL